jgi:hypothetical protein
MLADAKRVLDEAQVREIIRDELVRAGVVHDKERAQKHRKHAIPHINSIMEEGK